MPDRAIQDLYPDHLAHCYGCGRLNSQGLHIRTFEHDGQTVTEYTPEPWHTAVPGFVYGGMLASLVDCHSTATAAAAMARAMPGLPETGGAPRFVTASLHVDYLKPTPQGPLRLIGRVRELKGRKVIVETTVYAGDVATARGEVVAVQMPENFGRT